MPGKEKTISEILSPNVREILKKDKKKICLKNRNESEVIKYSRTDYLVVYQGYDFLENLMVVRTYIQKKYNIRLILLEILLYLYPKNIFTFEDYRTMPRDFRYNKIQNILDTGHAKIISIGENKTKNLYALSASGKNIVCNFYEHLSGEKKIPESYKTNPMAMKKACSFDKMKMETIKKLNQKGVKDHMKPLFE